MAKLLGYILVLLGILAIALSFEPVKAMLKIPLPIQLTPLILTIVGAVLVILGFLLARSKSSIRGSEVPIYHGKHLIGYRRV